MAAAPLAQTDVPTSEPVAPAVVVRSRDGGVTVRAVRIAEPLVLDGRLDEAVYREIPAISGFVQQEPIENAPASEDTDAWILFDRDNLYIAARNWDRQPERMVMNEMRKD